MGAFEQAWQVLKQTPNPELARLHQRMNELIAEFDRLSAARAQMGASRELDLQLDRVTTDMHYLEGEIARAEQPQEPPRMFGPYTEEELREELERPEDSRSSLGFAAYPYIQQYLEQESMSS